MARQGRSILCLVACLTWFSWANGMSASLERTADGSGILVLRGTIVAGDAQQVRLALQQVGRDALGYKRVALNSIGGLIGEAFSIAATLESEKVITLVRSGERCASACASILFLAGTYRYLEDGGALGFHTCASKEDLRKSAYCNELIAMYAESRGLSRSAFRALLDRTPLAEPRWIGSQEAALWGLTKPRPAADFDGTPPAPRSPAQDAWFAVMFAPAPDGTCLVKIVPASQRQRYEAVTDFFRTVGPFPTLEQARMRALQRAWRYDIQGNYWVTRAGC
jgi:hypothetical protein